MAFAREVSDRILFMADGKLVEEHPTEKFFTAPESDALKDFLSKLL
jgi:ABC-type polar amino acid transport system ATPase subunit